MYSSESMNYGKNTSPDLCFLSFMGRSDNIGMTLLYLKNKAAPMVAWSFAFCEILTWLSHLCKLPAGMTPVSMATEPLPSLFFIFHGTRMLIWKGLRWTAFSGN